MSKTKYKVEQVFSNTDETFEILLVKAINTYVANKENVSFEKGAIRFQKNKLKCI